MVDVNENILLLIVSILVVVIFEEEHSLLIDILRETNCNYAWLLKSSEYFLSIASYLWYGIKLLLLEGGGSNQFNSAESFKILSYYLHPLLFLVFFRNI